MHILLAKLDSQLGAKKSVFDLGMHPDVSMPVEYTGLYIWKGMEGKDAAVWTSGQVGLEA